MTSEKLKEQSERYERPLCAGGCGATGPARPERERRAIVSAEGATVVPTPPGPGEARLLNLSKGAMISHSSECDIDNDARTQRRQRSRIFHRMHSGIRWHSDGHLRHMVLTSSPKSVPGDMNYNKILLVQKIRRLTPNKLLKGEYIDSRKVGFYYPNKNPNSSLQFDYFSVRTDEGVSGVWHIAWFGDFIPHTWVSEQWDLLHGAKNISMVDYGEPESAKKLVGYILSHYIAGQNKILHSSYSDGWLKPGMIAKWKAIVKDKGYVEAIIIWNYMMVNKLENPPPGQIDLDGNMAELPFWVRGYLKKNREFRI